MHFEGAVRGARYLRKERLGQAWLVAALTRAKKLPRLEDVLREKRPKPRPQDWEEQLAIARAWHIAAQRMN